ncbi:hypothetical protein [Winogradskyella sp.]|uniref:hypothetical protein n=1 Tax=Winogradskyella sp. TaxID=1883156 RepID=UPI00262EEFA8|nr:hypothetical protein [Winogradskyella sp.]
MAPQPKDFLNRYIEIAAISFFMGLSMGIMGTSKLVPIVISCFIGLVYTLHLFNPYVGDDDNITPQFIFAIPSIIIALIVSWFGWSIFG